MASDQMMWYVPGDVVAASTFLSDCGPRIGGHGCSMADSSTAAHDRLSLTLPDWRTALKKRFKRPRRPRFWEVVGWFLSGWAILAFIVAKHPFEKAFLLFEAVAWAGIAIAQRRRDMDADAKWTLFLFAVVVTYGIAALAFSLR